jgi:hypothetical protein
MLTFCPLKQRPMGFGKSSIKMRPEKCDDNRRMLVL